MRRSIALGAMAAALILTGCGPLGKVEQGRVIAYDAHTRRVTLIPEAIPEAAGGPRLGPGTLPPVTVEAPLDPSEMGPAPVAGGLMLLDSSKARIVVYDRSTEAFRTIQYTLVAERHNVSKSPGPPVVDRAKKTITIYSAEDRALITFAASADLLATPMGTWRTGDVVRYYYKTPGQALRLMNVTATDLSKATG
jgi:hypothetical protein